MKPKLDWRAFLNSVERDVIAQADAAKAVWLELNVARAGIVSRAIHRAKAARLKEVK